MEVTLLLCDWAEEVNGKLYIMGAGWSRVVLVQPATMALAVKILVPWNATNRKHKIAARLLNEDGQPVELQQGPGIEPAPVLIEGEFEVGRPPGVRPGAPIDAPMALRFQNLPLSPGVYSWSFEVDGTEAARVGFDAVLPPQGMLPGTTPQSLPPPQGG